MAAPKPTRDDLERAYGTRIPDLVAPDLRVLFCGINPGLWSGATGRHFARPGNRFWRVLHEAGFTPRVLDASEGGALLALGYGITNMVARTTRTAAELTPGELRAGALRLEALAARDMPRVVAVVGVGAYRAGFDRPGATVGPQRETLAGSRLWVLPNPSGLNAHYQLPALVDVFAALRQALEDAPDS